MLARTRTIATVALCLFASWTTDLVLDLIYVVLLAHLGALFRSSAHSGQYWWAFRDFAALFMPIWFHWAAVAGCVKVARAHARAHADLHTHMQHSTCLGCSLKDCGRILGPLCILGGWGLVEAMAALVHQSSTVLYYPCSDLFAHVPFLRRKGS